MSDTNIWNAYGRWDEIAKLDSIDEIKRRITGNKQAWRPNFASEALKYIFEYAADEVLASGSRVVPTAVDYGCGLGRNGPMLSRFFPRVVGIDLPEMTERVKNEFLVRKTYGEIYSSVPNLIKHEQFCVLYDSVVFQHLVDHAYISDLVDTLSVTPSFRTIVSVYNANVPYPHLSILAKKGWRIWHSEVEVLSFEGAPHSVTTFRR